MIHQIHSLVWGPALLGLLLFAGLFFTVQSKGFQFRGFSLWWRRTVGSLLDNSQEESSSQSGSISRVQSACTALAATIGTGNIVGVASALTAGGPGAIFWMWVSAAVGMMTAYAETSLGIIYRSRTGDGRWIGGPMVYLSRGLKKPGISLLYGGLCLLASLGMGSMVQSNAAAQTLCYLTGMPPILWAAVITGLVVFVAWGGTHRVARVSERLVPVSAGIYILFSLAVLVRYHSRVLPALEEIFCCALLPESVLGGVGGYGIARAFRYGIARGVFSNEAGLGSLAGLHSATDHTTPQEQGMWAMFEVFFDTIVICTMTALVILCVMGGSRGLTESAGDGAVLTARCFRLALGAAGEYLVSGSMVVFAFATMIAWYYLGRQTLEAVLLQLGDMIDVPEYAAGLIRGGYLVCFGYAVFLGCVSSLRAVWELSDVWNGLMAFPNIAAILLLHKKITYPRR
ncbi:MAG: sodium:alanine symporter family protein [Hungatella sp.]|nr:sodium:alanine symporter family protein [Hungatella sp.]